MSVCEYCQRIRVPVTVWLPGWLHECWYADRYHGECGWGVVFSIGDVNLEFLRGGGGSECAEAANHLEWVLERLEDGVYVGSDGWELAPEDGGVSLWRIPEVLNALARWDETVDADRRDFLARGATFPGVCVESASYPRAHWPWTSCDCGCGQKSRWVPNIDYWWESAM